MNDLSSLKKTISFVGAADGEVKLYNPLVLDGISEFAEYVISELETQNAKSFDEVSIEDFNKLSVVLFDSGMTVSIVSAEVSDTTANFEFCLVDTWDEAEAETALYVDVVIDTKAGNVAFTAQVEDEEDASEVETISSILNLLGIKAEDADLVIPHKEADDGKCTLVVKERLMYLIGESLIQFGTRYRKMIDSETMQVLDEGAFISIPEFPGESSVILFGLFLVSEASELNEILTDDEEDEDDEVNFNNFVRKVDERPVEERLAEAVKEASNNKTLH